MASARGEADPTPEELLAQLGELGGEDEGKEKAAPGTTPAAASAPPAAPPRKPEDTAEPKDKTDPLADINSLIQERPRSRPETPRAGGGGSAPRPSGDTSKQGIVAAAAATAVGGGSQSRKSVESARSFHQGVTPDDGNAGRSFQTEASADAAPQAASTGGGWWGGIMATASAAVKQAEVFAKEIQKNEEAQRWADQVKGNVGVLRSYGGELRSRALPTFTNILHTLAPPISSHERLQIHITHDLVGFPSLDPLVYQTFSRVMAQVEGGDLMVIQRGHEASPRSTSSKDAAKAPFTGSSSPAGWSDGPWWRHTDRRNFGSVRGLSEGSKLVKASAESYAHEYFATRGGVEAAARSAAEVLSESNPTRSSDIFVAVQAIVYDGHAHLFDASSSGVASAVQGEADESNAAGKKPATEPSVAAENELTCFAIYLFDPVHSLTFYTITQTLPRRWADWLETPGLTTETEKETQGAADDGGAVSRSKLPEDIREMVEAGAVDPREWVAEWTEEVLALGIGVVAQRYVAKRMGVGEGGLANRSRAQAIEAGAGEAARAM